MHLSTDTLFSNDIWPYVHFGVPVYQEDVDEKYNKEEFVEPRFFKGNFTLLSKNLTLDERSLSLLRENVSFLYCDLELCIAFCRVGE